jgi:hypothetical protein
VPDDDDGARVAGLEQRRDGGEHDGRSGSVCARKARVHKRAGRRAGERSSGQRAQKEVGVGKLRERRARVRALVRDDDLGARGVKADVPELDGRAVAAREHGLEARRRGTVRAARPGDRRRGVTVCGRSVAGVRAEGGNVGRGESGGAAESGAGEGGGG